MAGYPRQKVENMKLDCTALQSKLAMLLAITSLYLVLPHPGHAVVAPAARNDGERQAEAVWRLRAALNVAALQCQYDPALSAVDNYNKFLQNFERPLDQAYKTMASRFKRGGGLNAFDRYNTSTYNSFSATLVQVQFCETSAAVAHRALLLEDANSLKSFAPAAVEEIAAVFPKKPTPAVTAKPASKPKAKTKKRKAPPKNART
jgi:hypothetical protein